MAHKLRLLSQLGSCRVEGCSCGVVHLSVGPVSIRLSAKNATELTQALVSASAQFQHEETVSAAEVRERGSDEDGGPPDGSSQIH